MNRSPNFNKEQALKREGWEIIGEGASRRVWAYGRRYKIVDPLAIHLHAYRSNPIHEIRLEAMKRAFCLLWPDKVDTYHYWMEDAFREHTNWDTECFTMAGGAACSKTYSAGFIAAIFFLSNPTKNAVIDASTTITSLKSRIHGYIKRAIKEASSLPKLKIVNSPQPQIHPVPPDDIHGIYGVAAKTGSDEKAISDIIGRHPTHSLLVILDEGTDMPLALVDSFDNLRQGLAGRLQVIVIGNSKDKSDLHGALSTPKHGWDSVTPEMKRWETTHPGGICLYFNPYESPAIHETDPIKKEKLSRVLMNEEKLLAAESKGTDTAGFWRFTMGFWKGSDTKATIVTDEFLATYDCRHLATFSGRNDIHYVAGLDPAFTTGGDKCILRLGILGQHISGSMILDFRDTALKFDIPIRVGTGNSAEIQIADAVIDVCNQFKIPLNVLCIDASGQGRALADVIFLRSKGVLQPVKIFSTNNGGRMTKNDMGIYISSAYDMWYAGREFISYGQIYGLDDKAYMQLHSRLVIDKNGKKSLETKSEYKKRMRVVAPTQAGSPDDCDGAMLAIQSAVINYGFSLGQRLPLETFDNNLSHQFDLAKKQYEEKFLKPTAPPIKPTFSKGIGSLVGRAGLYLPNSLKQG